MANQNANSTHNSKGSVRIQPVSMIVFCGVSSSSHLVTKCKDGWHESSSSEAKTSGDPLLAAPHVGGGGAFCHVSLFWSADVCSCIHLKRSITTFPITLMPMTPGSTLQCHHTTTLSECVQHITEWMGQNVLQLSAEKTEVTSWGQSSTWLMLKTAGQTRSLGVVMYALTATGRYITKQQESRNFCQCWAQNNLFSHYFSIA